MNPVVFPPFYLVNGLGSVSQNVVFGQPTLLYSVGIVKFGTLPVPLLFKNEGKVLERAFKKNNNVGKRILKINIFEI